MTSHSRYAYPWKESGGLPPSVKGATEHLAISRRSATPLTYPLAAAGNVEAHYNFLQTLNCGDYNALSGVVRVCDWRYRLFVLCCPSRAQFNTLPIRRSDDVSQLEIDLSLSLTGIFLSLDLSLLA
jgi:hypothetical protein